MKIKEWFKEYWFPMSVISLCVAGVVLCVVTMRGPIVHEKQHPTPPTPVYQKYAIAGGGFKWIVSQEFENMEEAMEWYLWLKDMEGTE